MKNKMLFEKNGQSLITMAVLSVVFIGILALAIDMGYTYLVRRAAQNAADAGALAGARQICYCNVYPCTYDPATEANLKAIEFAKTKNEIPGVDIAAIPNPGVTISYPSNVQATVKVDVTVPYNTFVAGFFGSPEMTMTATATAGCGPGTIAEKILPLAWECMYTTGEGGFLDPLCDVEFESLDTDCTLNEDLIYVFLDSGSDYFYCDDETPPTGLDQTLRPVECDPDGDDVHEVEPVNTLNPEHSWYWVDLNAHIHDAAGLQTAVEDGFNEAVYANTWHPMMEGNINSGMLSAAAYTVGDIAVIPVFNAKCVAEHPNTCTGWESGDFPYGDPPIASEPWWYRIDMFATLLVTCVDAGGYGPCVGRETLDPSGPPNVISPSTSSLEGCFVNGFLPGLYHGEDDPEYTGSWVVYMIE